MQKQVGTAGTVPFGHFYVVFRSETKAGQTFSNFSRKFFDVFVIADFFRLREHFSKFSLYRRCRNRPKIVQIGAILTIFRPFEIFGGKYSNSTENFKRPKHREDSSDLDENSTESIAAQKTFICKSFPRHSVSKKMVSNKFFARVPAKSFGWEGIIVIVKQAKSDVAAMHSNEYIKLLEYRQKLSSPNTEAQNRKRIPNGSRTDPERTPNGSRTDLERTPTIGISR